MILRRWWKPALAATRVCLMVLGAAAVVVAGALARSNAGLAIGAAVALAAIWFVCFRLCLAFAAPRRPNARPGAPAARRAPALRPPRWADLPEDADDALAELIRQGCPRAKARDAVLRAVAEDDCRELDAIVAHALAFVPQAVRA